MDIGQTFFIEGTEYAVKRIITPGNTDTDGVVYTKGRIDASKFVGEGTSRRIQRGRPKMFDYATVAQSLGEAAAPTVVESDISSEDEKVVEEWRQERSDPAKLKEFMSKFGHDKETVPSLSDW